MLNVRRARHIGRYIDLLFLQEHLRLRPLGESNVAIDFDAIIHVVEDCSLRLLRHTP